MIIQRSGKSKEFGRISLDILETPIDGNKEESTKQRTAIISRLMTAVGPVRFSTPAFAGHI